MSTWQIFSDTGNNFRWEISGRILPSKTKSDDAQNDAPVPVPPLPSMADLLLKGCSKLIEEGDGGIEKFPMFRTGLGKSVALKESSIAKALSILGDDGGGGRSLSVSSDALKRARSLLGDPELGTLFDQVEEEVPPFTVTKEENIHYASSDKENRFFTSFSHQGTNKSKDTSKDFICPLKSSFKQKKSIFNSENLRFGTNLIDKFDAVRNSSACVLATDMASEQKSLSNRPYEKNIVSKNSLANDTASQTNLLQKSFGRPLADISNTIVTSQRNSKQSMTEKRRVAKSSFVSPFKRPRLSSKLSAPLNKDVSLIANGLSTSSDDHTYCKRTVSTRYPFKVPRIYMKEYFSVPPSACSVLEWFSDQEKHLKQENADKYLFKDESGLSRIGVEAFYDMLAYSGASMHFISKGWVANHYKWIVWKLMCYERRYPSKCSGKFFTISNVLEELKYRYEREVNLGHRSAIKRILEGDASPSTMIVLCISAILSNSEPKMEKNLGMTNAVDNSGNAKVELTDGWYSVNAVLDVLLSKQLSSGKLFVGQKLRIWGAGLSGWAGPVSPLEASSDISLFLNINGTFRAHWADRLGFCKSAGAPLAFRCIKSDGGPVPQTLVGVTRIYPVLYRERLSNGGSIVRSERMESRLVQQHNQRCSAVVDHVISEYQRGVDSIHNDSESEGAQILRILETAAEPEVLMAEMSPEQLTSFATYKSKLEATRQVEMEKSIEKALAEAGLNKRDVVPFMRVRVVGLTARNYHGKRSPKEGIITIWNPTEKQKNELVEGQAYVVAGLIPMNSDLEILYLQARGSTTKWQPLTPLAMECFEPFFSPRRSIKLSNLGEIPLSSEFDIAAYVVYVGEVYKAAHQKKQWVFVTDDSISDIFSEGLSDSLLAISFSSPSLNEDSFAPINSNLVGSIVGFSNLIKKAKDQMNHIWVAEATENSAYFINFNSSICSHIKSAGASVQTWAKASNLVTAINF
ncbi:hypothetical protein COLO4_14461 [Corchorus olitorius]|uniref:Tower domain-containing protein n=1 Tax=Corchorus olitorius TaxID=93759 RepID=A0A1R3JRW9_9ROSI|nr:hypothetical protein COLO4_14461 [Corchorus olitorius]